MKISTLFLLYAILCGTWSHASELPTIENFDGWDPPPAVKGSADHLKRQYAPGQSSAATPTQSLVSGLCAPEHIYDWTPVWHQDGVGNIAVDAWATLSDHSGFALCERIGEQSGPNSTLIVIYNAFNGKIVQGFEVPQRKLIGAAFRPESTELYAFAAPQESLDQAPRLLVIDAASGKIVRESADLTWTPEELQFGADGETLYVVIGGTVKKADLATFSFHDFYTGRAPLRLAPLASGDLFLADADALKLVSPEGKILKEFPYNTFAPKKLISDGGEEHLLLLGQQEQARFFYGDAFSDWPDPVTAAAWLPKSGKYVLARRLKRQITLAAPDGSIDDAQGRLKGSRPARELIALPDGKFAIFDAGGKWQKAEPQKRNFRFSDFDAEK